MGSSYSKPATSPVRSSASEKHEYRSAAVEAHHHASSRLARIEAQAREASSAASTSRHSNSRWDQSSGESKGKPSATVALESLDLWNEHAFDDKACLIASRTLHNANIADSLHKRSAEVANQHIFSHSVPLTAKSVANQKSSGRCWLFALTNLIRLEVIKQLDIKDADFELSQSYLHFYDKLEKANYWLENVIDLADKPWDDRELNFLSNNMFSDGGQWDMATNLIVKYGVVPQSLYPESYNSSNTSRINWLATTKLREMAQELRDLKRITADRLDATAQTHGMSQAEREAKVLETVRAHKEQQMKDVFRILAIAYGKPPKPHEEIEFSWYDSKGRYQSLKTTPYDFQVKYTGTFTAKGSASLVNDPRNEYGKLITVNRLGNVLGAQPVLYLNTDTDLMIDRVVESIKAGHSVFFGCDVGASSHSPSGIMDTDLFDYETAFGITLGLSKSERLEMGVSQMTHAMVIDKVHIDPKTGKAVRFAVQNSWGPDVGKNGYMVMSVDWFKEYVYQVVIRREFVPKDLWQLFEQGVNEDSIQLPVYDPMGALA